MTVGSSSRRHRPRAENGASFSSGRCRRVSCAQSLRPRRPGQLHDLVGRDAEAFDEHLPHARRHVGLELEHRDGPVAQLLQTAFDGLQQVLRVGVIEIEIRIAHHAEEVRAVYRAAEEQRADVGADDVLEHDQRLAVAATAARAA